jgi:hypothetical protein
MFGLPVWAIKAIGVGLLAMTLIGTGARVAQIWYQPQITAAKAVQKEQTVAAHATKVVQAALTKSNAAAETQAQSKIVIQTRVIIRKVPVYVSSDLHPPVGCVTNGMLRLHDAAVLGIDPADLPPPTGQPDDACSTVTPSDFMAVVVGNYGAARQNGEQLNSLEADLKARIDAVASTAK